MAKILMMPVVAGLAYEVIKFSASILRINWSALGPQACGCKTDYQEPDDAQLGVAIAALKAVMPKAEFHRTPSRVVIATQLL